MASGTHIGLKGQGRTDTATGSAANWNPFVSVFLVERYVPSIEEAALLVAVAKLDDLSDDLVHHVTTVIISGEDTCISIIEAPDTVAVESLNERAGFAFDRIVEVSVIR